MMFTKKRPCGCDYCEDVRRRNDIEEHFVRFHPWRCAIREILAFAGTAAVVLGVILGGGAAAIVYAAITLPQ
jgi:hypothetical protein